MKAKHFFCEMYKVNFYYCLDWPLEHFAYYLKKNFNHDLRMNSPEGKCLIFNVKSASIIIIWVRSKKNTPILVHECVHAANMALDRAGVVADFNNDEAQAYLIDLVFRKAISK